MNDLAPEITPIKVRAAEQAKEGAEAAEVFRVDGAGVRPDGSVGAGIVLNDGKTVTLNARHISVKQAIADGVLVDVAAERKTARTESKAKE